jgi:hypothetical protein
MNMKMSRIHTALVVLGLAMPALVRADQQVSTKYSLPMKAYCKVTESGCYNSPGPTITLEGVIALGGLGANLIFQNNEKGTHTATVTYGTNVTLLALGGAIEIPKQPVQGGVGGNPHIWIQFHDGQGNNLTKEIYLGRCVQGSEHRARICQRSRRAGGCGGGGLLEQPRPGNQRRWHDHLQGTACAVHLP